MPLGLVGCKLDAGVNARAGADVSLRDVTIVRDETGDEVRMKSRTGSARRILGIWRKLSELKLDAERGGSTFGARWGETNLPAMGASRDRGQMKNPA